jgi:putative endonuclease
VRDAHPRPQLAGAGGAGWGDLHRLARDGDALVVCEVKTRRRLGSEDALAAVTPQKVAQLRRLAAAFLAATGTRATGLRIDAVAVTWPATGGRARVTHLRGIG